MFERYTEAARRALFFARYESSQLGARIIETEHLLLGLVREPKGIVARVFDVARATPEQIRMRIESGASGGPKISTSVEIPFSEEMVRVLKGAALEADALKHRYIGTEHLLLSLLREEGSVAGALLKELGIELGSARAIVADIAGGGSSDGWVGSHESAGDIIGQIGALAARLAGAPPHSEEASALLTDIHVLLEQLRGYFQQ